MINHLFVNFKAPPKAKPAAPAAKTAQGKGPKRKPLPKVLKKLVSHRSTQHLYAKLKRQAAKKKVAPESLLKKRPKFVVKKIGGEKNGGTRKVLVKRQRKHYPTEPLNKKRKSGKVPFKAHKRSLKQGKIFIYFILYLYCRSLYISDLKSSIS